MYLEDVRNRITTEMQRRAKLAFPTAFPYERDGGVWGKWTRGLPALHFYQVHAKRNLMAGKTRGVYQVSMHYQIEYAERIAGLPPPIDTVGEARMLTLQQGIELPGDEYLIENFGTDTPGSSLATAYSIIDDEIAEATPGVVVVALLYQIDFIEKYYGYDPV